MILNLTSISDVNRERLLQSPPLVWRFVAPDDPEAYVAAIEDLRPKTFLSRFLPKKKIAVEIPDLSFENREGRSTNLDKAWHAIHFVLAGEPWGAAPPFAFVAKGGTEVGNVDIGWAPARVFSSADISEIEKALERISEDQFRNRFDLKALARAEIYPHVIWEREPPEQLWDYVHGNFVTLREFVAQCSKDGMGLLVTCM